MKNILFITESYEIAPSPNGNIVRILANKMQEEGFNISVLALKNQYVKKQSIVNGVKVYRSSTHIEWAVMYSKMPKIIKSALIRVINVFKLIFVFMHPLRSPIVLLNLYRRSKKIVSEDKIDTVIGVYRDAETAYCAYKLKNKFPKLKLVIYTLDAISGGVCSNKFIGVEKHIKKCRKLEEKFVNQCDLYLPLVAHKSIYEHRFKEYIDKIKYVDLPNLTICDYDLKHNNEKINFVFTGMMTETNADCSYFLRVFESLSKIVPCEFNLYGGISDSLLKKVEKLEGQVIFHGKRTQNELYHIREKADVLCTFGNNYSCGVPCKIFEYIGTKKPILATYKIDDDAGKFYLEKYPKAILIKESEDLVEEHAKFIVSSLDEIKNLIITNEEIEFRFYKNTPREFIDLIKEM